METTEFTKITTEVNGEGKVNSTDKNKEIPWIKREEMEWKYGNLLLGANMNAKRPIIMMVRDCGNGQYVDLLCENLPKYPCSYFTHYAVITHPKVR